MKVLLLGATGSVGRQILEQGLRRGHEFTALVRDPNKIHALPGSVRVVKGDVLDKGAVEAALHDQDAVIQSIGVKTAGRTTVFSESTKILIAAMESAGVKRLVCITGVGVAETKGHGGFLYDRLVYPFFTRHRYKDKTLQEELIRKSPLDWVLVRPARFVEGALRGELQAVTDVRDVTLRRISRSEVAAFVLEQLTANRYLKKAPFIGHS